MTDDQIIAAIKQIDTPLGRVGLIHSREDGEVVPTYVARQFAAAIAAQLAAPVAAQPIQGDVATGYQGWLNATWTPHSSDRRHPFDAFKAGAEWAAK